jgi:hypothetical protein
MTISDLKQDDRITLANGEQQPVYFTTKGHDIYLWRDGSVITNQQDRYDPNTLKHLTNSDYDIIRVERQLDEEYHPIWTQIDGDIGADISIIKINERYYTKRFIENVFAQLKEWGANF